MYTLRILALAGAVISLGSHVSAQITGNNVAPIAAPANPSSAVRGVLTADGGKWDMTVLGVSVPARQATFREKDGELWVEVVLHNEREIVRVSIESDGTIKYGVVPLSVEP